MDINAGGQERHEKANNLYALAVSPGDVAAAPEAQTYALILVGLGLIGWRARRRG
jgi:MYXO-CTERM domain-containing protein